MDYLKLAVKTDFNPMAFVEIGEDKTLAIAENDQIIVCLNAIGEASISHINDISEEPKRGKKIAETYLDYLNILEKQEEYFIYTRNILTLSVYKKSGNDVQNLVFKIDNEIGDYVKELGIENLVSLEQILNKESMKG